MSHVWPLRQVRGSIGIPGRFRPRGSFKRSCGSKPKTPIVAKTARLWDVAPRAVNDPERVWLSVEMWTRRTIENGIGSGRVEAACKHVVALRMKRGDMRWSKPGSQNTISLRGDCLNYDWQRLWAAHPLAPAA